jgi:hypothetical protein
MRFLSRIAPACGCAVLAIVLSGCNPPIMVDRTASDQKATAPAAQTAMAPRAFNAAEA